MIPDFFEMTMLILFISYMQKKRFRDKEIRTPDTRFRRPVLYPLSYIPTNYVRECFFICGWRDLNPHAVLAAGDFKSPVSTIPPQPQLKIKKLGRTGFEPV